MQPSTGRGDKEQALAVLHLAFICELYEIQVHGGGYFLHTLTNSGCIAQALSSSIHSSTARQTIMSALSKQLQSDLSAAGTTDPLQHRLPLPKLEHRLRNGKLKTMSWEDHWSHVRSLLLVKRKYRICGTWRCTSTPPKRNREHERDANQLASSGLVPTKAVPKPHVTARVWCVRKCARKGSNRSSRQHLRWKLFEFCFVLLVRKTFFELKTRS